MRNERELREKEKGKPLERIFFLEIQVGNIESAHKNIHNPTVIEEEGGRERERERERERLGPEH